MLAETAIFLYCFLLSVATTYSVAKRFNGALLHFRWCLHRWYWFTLVCALGAVLTRCFSATLLLLLRECFLMLFPLLAVAAVVIGLQFPDSVVFLRLLFSSATLLIAVGFLPL